VFRRIAALVAALVLASAVFRPSPAAAFDNGFGCATIDGGNYHTILKQVSSQIGGLYFTGVMGYATIRDLGTCTKRTFFDTDGAHTAILPANIESPSSILQVGFGYLPGSPSTPRWFYADGTENLKIWSDPDFLPVLGHTYLFKISRVLSSDGTNWEAHYTIQDRTNTSYPYTWWSRDWPGSFDVVWWGYEQQNKHAYTATYNGATAPLKNLRYQKGGNTTWVQEPQDDLYQSPSNFWYFDSRYRCGQRQHDSGGGDIFTGMTLAPGTSCSNY
jgi:hypothetical protein